MKSSTCGAPCTGVLAEKLNSSCFCGGLELDTLTAALQADQDAPDVPALIAERCPHLFSEQPVFISAQQATHMAELVGAIESVIALPSWHAQVLAEAPAIARHEVGAKGVFFGYDFHLNESGIGLIEINTNSGGALLNAALARAQTACLMVGRDDAAGSEAALKLEQDIIDMFRNEWRLGGSGAPLRSIAIVDADPENQYMYPEFLLFRHLFARHGIDALIIDPGALRYADGRLWHGQTPIDLVYNRLTDFSLAEPASSALRAAYLARAAVITPHPRAHALYADKGHLARLTDPQQLQALGVAPAIQKILLGAIPHTEVVKADQAERLWAARRGLFFKPRTGYGGRAAYRGDKLTKRAWSDILAGQYVAQALVAPSERMTGSAEAPEKRKFDIRLYCYDDAIQWTAARVYQGQTTNFRTPGGGFASVYQI